MAADNLSSCATSNTIKVELAYALPDKQYLLTLQLPEGYTVQQAIESSLLLQRQPELELIHIKTGIFGHVCTLDYILKASDRIEIYRPLTQDPKAARLQRAAK